ncbi:PREDICTED: inositol 1,4,5-trisphosphate receptor-interacting protein-like 1 [Pseudopodoces humilis]|uniref:inositol 1,4,5-trisphosphate receptor-interacting protein-like 1 n=1 Tax=Pseudopodoces humilis TaxID=181119 RepID=UPI0006B82BE1|nr:PREDICTED: inositol 1,4,5-trisphosphate receptor-interacting protein-like 1 [Pseudopodoces humilis]
MLATFLLLLAQGLIQYPQQAGDGLDEATRERMQQRAEYLNQQMAQLIQEMEQKNLEQSGGAWGALLLWQFWAMAGILVLLLALWFGLGKIRRDPNSGHKERSSRNLVQKEVLAEAEEEGKRCKERNSNDADVEDNTDGNDESSKVSAKAESNAEKRAMMIQRKKETMKEIESDDAGVEEDNKDRNEEGSHIAAKGDSIAGNEAKGGNDDAKEEVNHGEKGEETNAARNEEDKHDANEEDTDHNIKGNLGGLLEVHIQLPVLDLDKGCSLIMDLMDKLTHAFGQGLSNCFYPVPQQAIEGWSPHTQDVVYHVFVPLSPPPGHAFHLELDTAGTLQRNFCVCTELLCTCTREQLGEGMLCFLHHSEEELIRKQDPSLLQTLCTGSYLDVEKTIHWFYRFVRAAWLLLPQSCHWHLMLQPCSRSCKFQISKDKESFMVEMVFGVRQGDRCLCGQQPTEVGIPSTTWPKTYTVAEAKFFMHISRQAPQDSWHCKCLQFLTRFLMGVGFSHCALKMVVMHLLNTVSLTRRLMDILKYLHCSLETKQLHHFIIGSERFPMEISLPSSFRVAEPPNLFQPPASSPNAYKKAVQEYICLLHCLKQLLIYGH